MFHLNYWFTISETLQKGRGQSIIFIFSLTEQDFLVVLLICFPINDKFNDMTHTKNIPSCCDVNNFASTLESKEWLSN